MKLTRTSANFLLVGVTIIWGSGFVVTKIAIDFGVSAGLVNLIRGVVFALCVMIFFGKKVFSMSKTDAKVGIIAGGLNAIAFILQTLAAMHTTPSNNAFLTVTNVIMVPLIVWAVFKTKPKLKLCFAVLLCSLGMAVLTGFLSNAGAFNYGDVLALLCAFFFALSIVYIAHNTQSTSFVPITFFLGVMQAVSGLLFFFVGEKGVVGDVNWGKAILPLLYLGVCSSFLCQTGQVVAQKFTTASNACLIMTLEGLFGSLFSVLFKMEPLTLNLALGGLLILLALFVLEGDFGALEKWWKKRKTKN